MTEQLITKCDTEGEAIAKMTERFTRAHSNEDRTKARELTTDFIRKYVATWPDGTMFHEYVDFDDEKNDPKTMPLGLMGLWCAHYQNALEHDQSRTLWLLSLIMKRLNKADADATQKKTEANEL